MTVMVTIGIMVAIFGYVIATAFPEHSTWLGDPPHPMGCLLALVALFALSAIGLMKLGAWLW